MPQLYTTFGECKHLYEKVFENSDSQEKVGDFAVY